MKTCPKCGKSKFYFYTGKCKICTKKRDELLKTNPTFIECIKCGHIHGNNRCGKCRLIEGQNRRARIKQVGGKLSDGLRIKLFENQKGLCACCGELLGSNYHLDHRMPLALGGANEDWNMQLLTATCNMKKGKKHPDYLIRGAA
jgi:5-methylcytosine-specific restriction endonuclease McrA